MNLKTSPEPKQLNTRIDAALHATVVAFAAMEGLSLNKWVERAIRYDLAANRAHLADELLRTVQGVTKLLPGISVDTAFDPLDTTDHTHNDSAEMNQHTPATQKKPD